MQVLCNISWSIGVIKGIMETSHEALQSGTLYFEINYSNEEIIESEEFTKYDWEHIVRVVVYHTDKSILTNLICITDRVLQTELCNFKTFTSITRCYLSKRHFWLLLTSHSKTLAVSKYFTLIFLICWSQKEMLLLIFLCNWLTYDWNQNDIKQLAGFFCNGKFRQNYIWCCPH